MIELNEITITEPTRAIICMGIPSELNPRFGTYYECVLDPQMLSPDERMLRFDQTVQGGEVHGWQRVAELTVVELLGTVPEPARPEGVTLTEGAKIVIRGIESWDA